MNDVISPIAICFAGLLPGSLGLAVLMTILSVFALVCFTMAPSANFDQNLKYIQIAF